ncbi:hypothetical protein [Gimesia maris]|uniref:hypothetical protein n=1 Tax=Gimesia maris TaxID=122 RepID=UPI0030DA9F50|tara:strand:- start:43063 stop:43251 length:189 start_codon:yes stop_codon:yes gene_type:complete
MGLKWVKNDRNMSEWMLTEKSEIKKNALFSGTCTGEETADVNEFSDCEKRATRATHKTREVC